MKKEGNVLFRFRDFKVTSKGLLIIFVLGIAVTCSFTMRSYPIKYGFFLNEADPFFNYRATKYMLDNGFEAYWKWHDNKSWYPEGRNVPESSQSGLHLTTTFLYLIFGRIFTSLLNFTIILPIVLASLTSIVMFALVKTITGGNIAAGMFSSLLFAFSPVLIQRGNLGWFKSEPLGLFLGLTALYLILSVLGHKASPNTLIKAAIAGVLLGLANASWGGAQYFIIPISLFFIALPFLRRDLRTPILVAITLTTLTLLTAALFPRPGIAFIFGLQGISLIGSTIFLVDAHFLKKLVDFRRHRGITLFFVGLFLLIGLAALIGGAYYTSDFRYLNALNPFTSPQLSVTQLVAEHAQPTLVDYLIYNSVLLFFAGLGAWFAFKSNNSNMAFALIIAITGVYVSAGLIRLMVFASIGIIILAAIGLAEIARSLWYERSHWKLTSPSKSDVPKKRLIFPLNSDYAFRFSFVIIIIVILLFPVIYPPYLNWIDLADSPPMIVATGSRYGTTSHDWLDSLDWISKNTPKNSVIAAWWDYGYWITTLGNRTTLADNANFYPARTATMGKMFMEQPERGINIARELNADYILIHVVAHRILINGSMFYVLGNGGDESKVISMIGVGGFDEKRYLIGNDFTNEFWNGSLLGRLIPFTKYGYTYFGSDEPRIFKEFMPDTSPLYTKHIKYPINDTTVVENSLNLVYSSPSFSKVNIADGTDIDVVSMIFIYKLNKPTGISNGSE